MDPVFAVNAVYVYEQVRGIAEDRGKLVLLCFACFSRVISDGFLCFFFPGFFLFLLLKRPSEGDEFVFLEKRILGREEVRLEGLR